MPDCSSNIRHDRPRSLLQVVERLDWPDSSKAPASIRRPSGGRQGRVNADVFEPLGSTPQQCSGTDNGVSARAAVPEVPEYLEIFFEAAEQSAPARPRCRLSFDGSRLG